nr:hypothetical protein [Sicyoidochytrium minutum DNA virus]
MSETETEEEKKTFSDVVVRGKVLEMMIKKLVSPNFWGMWGIVETADVDRMVDLVSIIRDNQENNEDLEFTWDECASVLSDVLSKDDLHAMCEGIESYDPNREFFAAWHIIESITSREFYEEGVSPDHAVRAMGLCNQVRGELHDAMQSILRRWSPEIDRILDLTKE